MSMTAKLALLKITQTPPISAERTAHLLQMAGDVNKTLTHNICSLLFIFICQNEGFGVGIFKMRGGESFTSPYGRAYFNSNTPNLKETRIGKWASVSIYH